MQAIREKGLRIPEDVSVISNGLEDVSSFECDFEGMGRKAVERLVRRITDPDEWKPERIIVPFKTVNRNTINKIMV